MSINRVQEVGCRVIIVGASSHLGGEIARLCLDKNWEVTGTYREKSVQLTEIEKLYEANGKNLELFALDVLCASEITDLCVKLSDRHSSQSKSISIIYCCGKWGCGDIETIDCERFDDIVGVGLRAPFLLTADALRQFDENIQIILITGLGGEKNSFASNSLYSITTNGVYNLVKSVGAELAGTGSICMGLALGLYDKGQAYASELGGSLNIGKLPVLDKVAEMVVSQIESRDRMFNGSVIELAGGLFNYQKTIEYLKTLPNECSMDNPEKF